MRSPLLISVCTGLLVALACATSLGAQQPDAGASGQYTVLRAKQFALSAELGSHETPRCTIVGSGNLADMQCDPPSVTSRDRRYFNTALVVDTKGVGYIISCKSWRLADWCKPLTPGTTLDGSAGDGRLSVIHDAKTRRYDIITTANVGQLHANASGVPAASASEVPVASTRVSTNKTEKPRSEAPSEQPAAASAMPDKAASEKPTASVTPDKVAPRQSAEIATQDKAEPDQPAAIASSKERPASCASNSGACVTFTSQPPGADLLVDGKLVGSTPSMISLPTGSHSILIETKGRKPWTLTMSAASGDKVTIQADLELESPSH